MGQIFWEFERRLLRLSHYFGPQKTDLSGQKPIVIITGGSEGIGLSLANACAELNLDLLLIARNPEKLRRAQNDLQSDHPVRVDILSIDLSADNSADIIATYLAEKRFIPHLLINNVGIGYCGPFLQQNESAIEQMIDVNIASWTRLTRKILPIMVKRNSGGIINISSLAGMVPGPYQATYYASKAYMNSLSEALSHELLLTNIRVSAVAPGPVATQFHRKMGADRSAYLFLQSVLSPDTVARSSIIWFALGRRMIVPGILNFVNSIFVRIIPHVILLWIMGILLKRRRKVGQGNEMG